MTFYPFTGNQTVSGALAVTGGLTVGAGIGVSSGNITASLGNISAPLGQMSCFGPMDVTGSGNGYKATEAANSKQGTGTLAAGTVTVANTSVTANSRIFITSNADGGTPGFLRVASRVVGTSFTVTSSSGTDTSTFAYEIFEPG